MGQLNLHVVEDVKTLRDEVKKSFEVLHVHAAAEEEFVFPHIEQKNRELSDRLNSDHQAFTPIMDSLEDQLEALTAEDSPEGRIMEGYAVLQALNDFIVQYSEHMQVEEKMAMPVLWEVLDDNQIVEAIGKMSMKPAPEVSQYFLPYLVQATNPMERVGILSGMKANMPSPVFEGAIKIVQNALSEEYWAALKQALR